MKKLFSVLASFLMVLSLCACSSSYEKSAVTADSYAEAAAEFDYVYEESSGFSANSAFSVKNGNSLTSSDIPYENPDKIIYTGNVTLETLEYDNTINGISNLISESGSYLESSSLNASNLYSLQQGRKNLRSAYYIIRVPADKFEKLMGDMSSLGNIPSSSVSMDNVSSQYYDSSARLKVYEAQETRLLELLEKAESVSEILEIESQLSDVRYSIESIKTKLNSWDKQVAYSTIYLDIVEVSQYSPVSGQESFADRIKDAFVDSLSLLEDFIVGLISILPVLILICFIIFLIIIIIRKRMSLKGRKKADEKLAKSSESQETPVE